MLLGFFRDSSRTGATGTFRVGDLYTSGGQAEAEVYPVDQLLLEIHGNADFGGGAYDFAAFANWWEKLEAAGLR